MRSPTGSVLIHCAFIQTNLSGSNAAAFLPTPRMSNARTSSSRVKNSRESSYAQPRSAM